jgi:hypothetical protein
MAHSCLNARTGQLVSASERKEAPRFVPKRNRLHSSKKADSIHKILFIYSHMCTNKYCYVEGNHN